MYITHTSKPGESLKTIVTRFKIKDPATILKHKNNRSINKVLTSGKELPKGTKVMIPDPKGKIYVIKSPSGVQYMNEANHKAYLKGLHKKMDEVVFKLEQTLNFATRGHDHQCKIDDDQWFISACMSLVNSVPEPKSRKKAVAAFSAVKKACTSRNYLAFEKTAEPANIVIEKYSSEVEDWVDGIINSSVKSVNGLKNIVLIGKICGSVAATTLIAPVGVPAAILAGTGVGAGTSVTFDFAENVGHVIAGTKPRPVNDILKRASVNALVGGIGGGVVGVFMKVAGPQILTQATNSKFLIKQVTRLHESSRLNLGELYRAEIEMAYKKLAVESLEGMVNAEGPIMKLAITKFTVRTAGSSLAKYFKAGDYATLAIAWIRDDPKRVSGKSPKKPAEAFATELAKTGGLDPLFDRYVEGHKKELRNFVKQEIQVKLKNL